MPEIRNPVITALIAPPEFNAPHVLEKCLRPEEVGFLVVCDTAQTQSPFITAVQIYCGRQRVSFMCFYAHWDQHPEDADTIAILNLSVANRLVVFFRPEHADPITTRLIIMFKKQGRPVQVIPVVERKVS